MSTFTEREEALRRLLDAPEPTSWQPADDTLGHPKLLIGELVGVEEGFTRDWGAKQIAILKDAEGRLWNVWLLHKVLIDEFVRKQPKIGEMLAIRYEGKVQPEGGGSAYTKYRLVVERGTRSDVDWRDADGGFARTAGDAAPAAAAPAPAVPAPAPPAPATDACGTCGWLGGNHAPGCPDDIPF